MQNMRAQRAKQLALMQDENHMKGGVTDYSLEAGLNDVYRYYNAGTLVGAIESIASAAGSENQEAHDKQLENSRKVQKIK